MAVDFKDLTVDQLFAALPYLVNKDVEGEYVFNVKFAEVDGKRVKSEYYWVKISNGEVTYGEGKLEDPNAVTLDINQGGLDTVIAFQVHGLQAGINAMMLGYIFTRKIKKAEQWFKLLKTGKDAVVEALKKAGIEVGDTELPIYQELMLT